MLRFSVKRQDFSSDDDDNDDVKDAEQFAANVLSALDNATFNEFRPVDSELDRDTEDYD